MNFQKAMERAERELDDAKDHEYYLVIEKNKKKELFCRSRHLCCKGPFIRFGILIPCRQTKRRNFSAGAVIFVAKGHGSHPWTYKF
jgi:hypothetical protein